LTFAIADVEKVDVEGEEEEELDCRCEKCVRLEGSSVFINESCVCRAR